MFFPSLFVSVITLLIINGERLPPSTPSTTHKPKIPAHIANNFKTEADLLTTQNLTFIISAKDLPSKDLASQVDPYVKLYSNSKEKVEFEKFGTSDVVMNNPNPEFNNVFWFIWKKGTQQKWNFKLKDQDTLRPDNPLGEVTIDVDQYIASKQQLNVSLSLGGSLLIQKTTPLKYLLYARNLPKSDVGFGDSQKADPFVECYWRRGSKGTEIKYYTTVVLDNVLNPDWNETIEFSNYIKGTDQWWVFKIYDHDGVSSNDELGEALLEVDTFAEKRQTKILKIGKDGQSQLGITPA